VAENLAAEGFGITIRQHAHTFVRFTVQGAEGDTEVDPAVDVRLFPSEPGELSPVLSSRELGVDKVLAVFGRAEPRDFVDLVAVEPLFCLKLLMQLAKVKNPGIDLTRFAEALGRFAFLSSQEFNLDDSDYRDLQLSVTSLAKLVTSLDRSRGMDRGR